MESLPSPENGPSFTCRYCETSVEIDDISTQVVIYTDEPLYNHVWFKCPNDSERFQIFLLEQSVLNSLSKLIPPLLLDTPSNETRDNFYKVTGTRPHSLNRFEQYESWQLSRDLRRVESPEEIVWE